MLWQIRSELARELELGLEKEAAFLLVAIGCHDLWVCWMAWITGPLFLIMSLHLVRISRTLTS